MTRGIIPVPSAAGEIEADPSMPGEPGEASCRPYSCQLRAIDFEQLDVDDHLGPGLVDGGDQARCSGHALRRVLDGDRVVRGGRRDAARVEHEPHQVLRFFQVGVAQIEGAHDLFLILPTLGRCIGDDEDSVFGGDTEKCPRGVCNSTERGVERRVPEIDRDWRFAERGIEAEADARQARDREKDQPAARVPECQRIGHLHVGRQIETDRRQVARPLDQRLELGFSFTRHCDFGPELIACVGEGGFDLVARGIQLGRQLKFNERFLELSASRKPAAPIEMIGGGTQLGALEAIAGGTVVGVFSERVRVLGDGSIVFLVRFGFLPELESR